MPKKKSIIPVSAPEATPEGSPPPEVLPQRPGTSGTELLLTTNRRTASANYIAAQRAEQAYKAKKRSAGARQHRADAKAHFSEAGMHFKEGCKSCLEIAKAVPWMVRGWKEDRQQKGEAKRRERDLEKKKKLEERIARQEEMAKQKEKEGQDNADA